MVQRHLIIMKGKVLLLHFGILSLFGSIGSAAMFDHRHAIRALSSAEPVNSTVHLTSVPSAAPSIPPSAELPSPSAPPSTILDPGISYLSKSDSSTIPDNSQPEGMNLFQTCATVIFAATILGLFGHFGMKLLPNRFREDNSQNEFQIEDTLACSRSPRTSVPPRTSVINFNV